MDLELVVGPDTDAVRASIVWQPPGQAHTYDWTLVLVDPDGEEVAASEVLLPREKFGVSVLHLDLAADDVTPRPGTWTVHVTADGLADPLPRLVTVAVTQLTRQHPAPPPRQGFTPTGALDLRLADGTETVLLSPEGCSFDPAAARGTLQVGPPDGTCRAGGFIHDVFALDSDRAEFVSAPLPDDVTIGGQAMLRLHLIDDTGSQDVGPLHSPMSVLVHAIDDAGRFVGGLTEGLVTLSPDPATGLATAAVDIPATTVPAGARLRLALRVSGLHQRLDDAATRLLWGGAYSASGLELTTGALRPAGGGPHA